MPKSKPIALSGSLASQATPQVIVVMLRQPRMHQPTEMRSDPFWEYGSFGLTGCHQRNLMHPKKAHLLEGARLAFVQGGEGGQRLVYLTPPVHAIPYSDRTEVKWETGEMPFRYTDAPIVLNSDGFSDVTGLIEMIADCKRHSWMGRFASKFRTRREPLPEPVAQAMVEAYEAMRSKAGSKVLARRYEEALPVKPPKVDRARRKTYTGLLVQARFR